MTARAARVTAAGTGAVATIAIAGDQAWPIIQSLFRARSKTTIDRPPEPGTILLGNFGQVPGDEVVLTTRCGTSLPWYEVHCHGGIQVVSWLLEQIENAGAAIVDWHELESANCRDVISALALKQLPHALTARAAGVLLDQFHGALSNELHSIIELIGQSDLGHAQTRLDRLTVNAKLGERLTNPWRVAVCGPPNAGKSSLVNALAGYQRAIVTPTPGTTRDVVSTLLAFDGWPVELLDTAGLRTSSDLLEEAGIQLGLQAATDADLVLWVTEPAQPMEPPPALASVINVFNKCDVQKGDAPGICISALTGQGLDQLISEMMTTLIPSPPQPGEAVVISKTLTPAMNSARNAVSNGDADAAQEILARLMRPVDSA